MIHSLQKLDDLSQHMPTTIPIQVLVDIDSGRNPMQLTRERLERTAAENQFMNGKIHAISVSSTWKSTQYGTDVCLRVDLSRLLQRCVASKLSGACRVHCGASCREPAST